MKIAHALNPKNNKNITAEERADYPDHFFAAADKMFDGSMDHQYTRTKHAYQALEAEEVIFGDNLSKSAEKLQMIVLWRDVASKRGRI